MKFKLYLQMFVALMVAMLSLTGCNDPEELDGPTGPISFELEVSSIEAATATVTVTPSNDVSTYYCGAIEKSVFDALATDEAFLAEEIARMKKIAADNHVSLKDYIGLFVDKGKKKQYVTTNSSKTQYYAYVFGINTDGKITSKIYKTEFTSSEVIIPVEKPIVKPEMWAGDAAGANKSSILSFKVAVTKSPAVSGKYFFAKTSVVDQAIADGATLESIVGTSTTAFSAEMITAMNSAEGLTGYAFGSVATPLEAKTEYTLIVMAITAQEAIGVASVKASTDAAAGGGGDAGPTVKLTLAAGIYPSGGDPTTQLHLIIQSTPMDVTAGKYFVAATSLVQEVITAGGTYSEIIAEFGADLTADRIAIINKGGLVLNFNAGSFDPNTSYTAIVSLTNPGGSSLGTTVGSTTGDGGGGDDGDLTFSFAVTEITATAAKMRVTPSNMTAPYYFDFIKTSVFTSFTDAELIEEYKDLADEYPSTGIDGYDPKVFETYPLVANTDYTLFAFGYADGAATTAVAKHQFKTNAAGDITPTDAYNAWLGTWTVTSTSSEVNKKPLSYDVTFAQKVANTSYAVKGWTITGLRDIEDVDIAVKFNSADGGIAIENQQSIATLTDGVLTYIGRALDPKDGKTYIAQGAYDGLTGVIDASKTAATVTGYQITFQGDDYECTITSMEYLNKKSDGKWGGYVAAEGFANSDYPVGPYTLTKKATASVSTKGSGKNIKSLSNNKIELAKSAVAKIPVFSSIMKQMTNKTPINNGVNTKLQSIKFNANAQQIASKPTTYEMVLLK